MIYNESKYNQQWDTKKLSDLGTFERGKSKHRPRNDERLFHGGGYPLVQTAEIKDANLYITHHEQEYGEFGLNQSKLWDAETLCITIAANIAETALLSYPMCFPDSVVGFKAYKDASSEKFMYYVFEYIRRSIQNSVTGSIQDNINIEYLTSLTFKIPSKKIQDTIVSLLSAIDEKILINSEINDYLEEMAKTIYDYWFVQFDFPNENGKLYKSSGGKMVNANGHIIPEGWTFCKVQDIISNICTGLNPRDNFKLGTGDIKYITVKNLTTNGTLDFTGCDTIDESARTIVHNRSDIQIGDILFASIAPLGRCYLIQSEPTDWDINESVFSIRANTDIITPAFLYLYFMSDAFIKHATSSSTGSIFKGIRINTLLETELCVPPLSVILKFEERLASIFPLKSKNYEEIQRLSNLRDWLLPMLMNGQATIED